ncbi:hypothetical protein GCM10010339_30500 [Streptomyces alanosinicus]|uniref:Uncharacterized protein n=1 Tax=Streptomyces alanosinicus TaxID=68171 RepID=A0A918YGN6_9ACTN|nr:hypothetical protein GCM10010339_30500 [Streptomyces alanosinicus]
MVFRQLRAAGGRSARRARRADERWGMVAVRSRTVAAPSAEEVGPITAVSAGVLSPQDGAVHRQR